MQVRGRVPDEKGSPPAERACGRLEWQEAGIGVACSCWACALIDGGTISDLAQSMPAGQVPAPRLGARPAIRVRAFISAPRGLLGRASLALNIVD